MAFNPLSFSGIIYFLHSQPWFVAINFDYSLRFSVVAFLLYIFSFALKFSDSAKFSSWSLFFPPIQLWYFHYFQSSLDISIIFKAALMCRYEFWLQFAVFSLHLFFFTFSVLLSNFQTSQKFQVGVLFAEQEPFLNVV